MNDSIASDSDNITENENANSTSSISEEESEDDVAIGDSDDDYKVSPEDEGVSTSSPTNYDGTKFQQYQEQIFGSDEIICLDQNDGKEEGLKLQRLFRSLHFENPGDVMKNQKIPDLESSYKEQSLKERLRTRRLPEKTSENSKMVPSILDNRQKLLQHNRNGKLVLQNGTAEDLCDCLSRKCLGCHLPCSQWINIRNAID